MSSDDDRHDLPVRQRTVSAAEAGTGKPSGAVSSVFEAGRKAKKPRTLLPLLDAAAVKIRKNVPLPPPDTTVARSSAYKALLDRLQPGDSVELASGHAKSCVSYAKKHNIKVAVRRLTEGTMALWRL